MPDSDESRSQHMACRTDAGALLGLTICAATIGPMLGLLHSLLLPIPDLDARRLTLRSLP